jgi:hypothetical protein
MRTGRAIWDVSGLEGGTTPDAVRMARVREENDKGFRARHGAWP